MKKKRKQKKSMPCEHENERHQGPRTEEGLRVGV